MSEHNYVILTDPHGNRYAINPRNITVVRERNDGILYYVDVCTTDTQKQILWHDTEAEAKSAFDKITGAMNE